MTAGTAARPASVAAGLRAWARGLYALEAAVELLLLAFGGRFAAQGWPWVQSCEESGWWWLDAEALAAECGRLSSGEQRVLAVVASTVGGPPVDPAWIVSGLDRANLELVLAALSHAGESHEPMPEGRHVVARLGPLVPWPGDGPDGWAA